MHRWSKVEITIPHPAGLGSTVKLDGQEVKHLRGFHIGASVGKDSPYFGAVTLHLEILVSEAIINGQGIAVEQITVCPSCKEKRLCPASPQ